MCAKITSRSSHQPRQYFDWVSQCPLVLKEKKRNFISIVFHKFAMPAIGMSSALQCPHWHVLMCLLGWCAVDDFLWPDTFPFYCFSQAVPCFLFLLFFFALRLVILFNGRHHAVYSILCHPCLSLLAPFFPLSHPTAVMRIFFRLTGSHTKHILSTQA